MKLLRIFRPARHDLTYFFNEYFRICHGGKEDPLEQERVMGDFEYQLKRDVEIEKIWKCALTALTMKELQCFYLYYLDRTPQEKIAKLMDVTQEAVNKLLRKSIKKIKIEIMLDKKQGVIF